MICFEIEGAVVMGEMKTIKGVLEFPRVNSKYKYLTFDKIGFPFVSADLKEWVLAISVVINGKEMNPNEIYVEHKKQEGNE